jgi:uncharacterized coiled-coil DUF342 family protein
MPEIKLIVEPDRAVSATLELILMQLNKMEQTEEKIMATVQEMSATLDEIAVDQKALLDEIQRLQNQGGANQAELDTLYAKAKGIADKVPTA